MKVLFDYQTLMQKMGGVSRYHCELKKHLDKIENVSCDIPGLLSQNIYFENEFGIKAVKRYLPKTRRIIKMLNKIHTGFICRTNKYDILHPTWYDPYILKFRGESKIVYTIHDMIPELFPEHFPEKVRNERKQCFFAADKIIAVSENTKRDILKIYPQIPQDKISVVYESASLSGDSEDIAGLPEHYILYVGTRKEYYKNFAGLFEASAPLLKEYRDLYLVCVGGGMFNKEEIAEFQRYGAENKVMQIQLKDEQMNTVYRRAMCFVYPSFYEGFGLPVLEAMWNDCPCALSNKSSIPEVAEDAAIYFDPTDKKNIENAIRQIITDTALKERLVERGQIQRLKFSWDKAAQETYQVYMDAVKP